MYQMSPMNWMMMYLLINTIIIMMLIKIYWMKLYIKWQ